MCVGESLLVPYYVLGSFPYYHKRLHHISYLLFSLIYWVQKKVLNISLM